MVRECVETDRSLAKSNNRAVIAQWPELALIGTTPETMTSVAPIATVHAIAIAVSHGCFTTARTSEARSGSSGPREGRDNASIHSTTTATTACMSIFIPTPHRERLTAAALRP